MIVVHHRFCAAEEKQNNPLDWGAYTEDPEAAKLWLICLAKYIDP